MFICSCALNLVPLRVFFLHGKLWCMGSLPNKGLAMRWQSVFFSAGNQVGFWEMHLDTARRQPQSASLTAASLCRRLPFLWTKHPTSFVRLLR